MTIQVTIRKSGPRIVPVRFVRAVTGPPQADAPDVDDRGFFMGNRPGTWGASDCRGPMVGITQGDTVRVRALTPDIDAGAPLFVTSTDTSIVTVAALGGGAQLGGDGIFVVTGVLDTRNRPVKVQVHLGSTSGPVLGELEPHIFQLHQLPVRAHLVSINGIATTRTAASLVPVFQTINKIFRACGIEFQYDPAVTVNTAVNGLAVAGQMTTNLFPPGGAAPTFGEFSRIINTNPDPNRINIYFIFRSNQINGLTFANDVARPSGYGIVIAERTTIPNTAATTDTSIGHELCHYLDNPDHVDQNAAGNQFRNDIVTLRSLMLSTDGFNNQNPAFRNDVGYGVGLLGGFIRIKKFTFDPIDGELDRARRRSLHPF